MMAKLKFFSILIIVLLPLLIFTGCSYSNEYINSFKQYINDQENNIGSGEIEQKDNLKNVIESKGSKNSNENLVAICIPYSTDDSTILEYLGFDYQQDTFFIATIFDYIDIFPDANIITLNGKLFNQDNLFDFIKNE